jgi:hypothetical protein
MRSETSDRCEASAMFIRTSRLTAVGLAAVSTLVLQAAASPTRAAAASVAATCANDTSKDTTTLQNAINNAGAGGTVTIAAGTCALTNRLTIWKAVTLNGAGATATNLIQHSAVNIVQINVPGVTVSNLLLDTATFNPGQGVQGHPKPAVLFSAQSNTTIRNVTALAGSGFGMRISGSSPCPNYSTHGTVVDHLTISNSGTGGFASLDIDCTNGATLSNITIHGNYIALYQDTNVTLTNETYTPQAKPCQVPWYLTGPSSNITIDHVAGGGKGIQKGTAAGGNTNVVVTNQTQSPGC